MVEWANVLRARGLKTAVLSNMSRTVSGWLRQTAKWLAQFDHLSFSGELKMAKPGLEIYRSCLGALRVPAQEALFLDDREVNVMAARAVGMHGIVFRSVEELSPELEPYRLGLSLAEAKARVG
jgi:putative hydrolase of the HAD superfamily